MAAALAAATLGLAPPTASAEPASPGPTYRVDMLAPAPAGVQLVAVTLVNTAGQAVARSRTSTDADAEFVVTRTSWTRVPDTATTGERLTAVRVHDLNNVGRAVLTAEVTAADGATTSVLATWRVGGVPRIIARRSVSTEGLRWTVARINDAGIVAATYATVSWTQPVTVLFSATGVSTRRMPNIELGDLSDNGRVAGTQVLAGQRRAVYARSDGSLTYLAPADVTSEAWFTDPTGYRVGGLVNDPVARAARLYRDASPQIIPPINYLRGLSADALFYGENFDEQLILWRYGTSWVLHDRVALTAACPWVMGGGMNSRGDIAAACVSATAGKTAAVLVRAT